MNVTIRKNLENVEQLFTIFNNHFFSGRLVAPILTFNPNSNARKTALGWCTTKKIWNNKDTEEAYYEITICPEFLDRSVEEISATLIHEMVHLYNTENEIQDCSRGNTYHNKRFKQEAEKRGLIISFHKKIGWSMTKLSEDTKRFIENNVHVKMIPLVRGNISRSISGGDEDGECEQRKGSIKYQCPFCGVSVRATKEVNIKCMDCNEELEEQ